MKKIKFFILLCLLGMVSIAASAEEIPNNEIWYEASAKLAETNSSYSSGLLHINAFNTAINSHTFSNGKGVITFDADVTSIGEHAFRSCSGLTSVTIPNSVTSIGEGAFYGCTSLPVENNLRYADTYLVGAIDKTLSTYNIKEGTKWIGDDAFSGCYNLTSVTIPNSVTSIGRWAFSGCKGLTSVTIPNSVTSIGEWAFYNCSGLTSVTIGNSVAEIGSYAFYLCSGLTSVTIPNSVTVIRTGAFNGCSSLTSIEIPNFVTNICNEAFYGCKGLTSVTIPNSVTLIQERAFGDCSGLTSVTIGNSVTTIYEEPFKGSNNIKELIYAEGTKTVLRTWLTSITSVTIPNSVIKIDDYAFQACSGLTSVIIPNSVTSIGKQAFWGCSGLASITAESGNTVYDSRNNCNAIIETNSNTLVCGCKNTIIPNSVTSIGSYAFNECSGLTSVTIPKSVTSIGDRAFGNCSSLTSVYVGWKDSDQIPSIGYGCFLYSICDLYVPYGTPEQYKSKNYWQTFKNIIELEPNIVITNVDGTDGGISAEEGDNVALNDNIQSISIAEGINNVNVTYTRNFEKSGVWQAWYMPFDVDFDNMKGAYDVAQIHGVLLDKDNNAVLAFLKLDKGTVNANTPYVVRPKKSGEVAITTTTDLQPTQSNSFLMMSATDKYTIGGVYEQTTTPGNWYALNLDGQFQLMDTGVYLRPFRIYITIDPREDNPYATSVNANAKMDIVVLGDDETTGITSYENDNDNENLKAMTKGEGAIYNLKGQRVASIVSGQIYIMNGKKYIAK